MQFTGMKSWLDVAEEVISYLIIFFSLDLCTRSLRRGHDEGHGASALFTMKAGGAGGAKKQRFKMKRRMQNRCLIHLFSQFRPGFND
jgi:hypothetical protein